MIVRNILEPVSKISKDLCRLCRHFDLDHSILCHSLELFDQFYSNLLEYANNNGFIWLDNEKVQLFFNRNLGSLLLRIDDSQCYDYLFWILFDDHAIDSGIRAQYVHNHGRTLCLLVCLLISAKINSCRSFLNIKKIQHFLRCIDLPSDFCKKSIIIRFEREILDSIRFEICLKTLNNFIETLMSVILRSIINYEYIDAKMINQLFEISNLLTQNYYICRVLILIDLFEKETERIFALDSYDNLVILENFSRNKMLIAAGIVTAVFQLDGFQYLNDAILNFVAEKTMLKISSVKNCQDAIINSILN